MAPLICLVSAFLFFRIIGIEWAYFADWHLALRAALGVMFLLTASAHWGIRRADLIRMVPGRVGSAGTWVTITGVAEIAIAIGLQILRLAPWKGVVLSGATAHDIGTDLHSARLRLGTYVFSALDE